MQAIAGMSEKHDRDTDINLTPMLDVVFIMLIFFVVTASFIKETGIDVSRSEGNHRDLPAQADVLIAISERSDIRIDGRTIDPRAVRANIERLRAENPGARVLIQAHERSFNRTLVQVMDAARQAGVYDLSLTRN